MIDILDLLKGLSIKFRSCGTIGPAARGAIDEITRLRALTNKASEYLDQSNTEIIRLRALVEAKNEALRELSTIESWRTLELENDDEKICWVGNTIPWLVADAALDKE